MIVVAAGTTAIILLTQKGDDTATPPVSTSVENTDGGIREYPSLEVTVDPAVKAQTDAAKPEAEKWVSAINKQDFDAARAFQCSRDQGSDLRRQLRGIDDGTFKVASIGSSKGKVKLLLGFQVNGTDLSKALSMVDEGGTWKVCIATSG